MIQYETLVYFNKNLFWIGFLTYLITVASLILISLALHTGPVLLVIGFIILCVSPFLFEKKIKGYFTKRALLKFDNEALSIEQFDSSNNIKKQMNFEWENIKSYKFYFSPTKFTYLSIYLKNGLSSHFSFKDNKTFEEAHRENSVFSLFYSYVGRFNFEKSEPERIHLAQGFLTTKTGSIFITVLCLLVLVTIISHIYYKPKSSPISFFLGFFILLQLLYKRKNDINFLNTMKQLDQTSQLRPKTP